MPDIAEPERPKIVAVTGASGLVGGALTARLHREGNTVRRLVRRPAIGDRPEERDSPRPDEIVWNPAGDRVDAAELEGVDAVVHLAGENIASGRWTAAKKKRIYDSRVQGTGLLARTLAELAAPPKLLISASAIGFYGDRDDTLLDERSEGGDGYLAELCQRWEAATLPAQEAGIRVVIFRIGLVLSADGGALAKMLTPFRCGVGGIVGDGRQFVSWITRDDVVSAFVFAIQNEALNGPVNLVAPDSATNRQFTKTLGRVLHRPTLLPMPALVARLALGEMANELLLASTRVRPARLLASGFEFRYPELEGALRHVLGQGGAV